MQDRKQHQGSKYIINPSNIGDLHLNCRPTYILYMYCTVTVVSVALSCRTLHVAPRAVLNGIGHQMQKTTTILTSKNE